MDDTKLVREGGVGFGTIGASGGEGAIAGRRGVQRAVQGAGPLDGIAISGAAALLNQLGGMGEVARELAYRLFSICERKKWADEALAYNSLVIAWPELSKLALSSRNRQSTTQAELFS